MLETAMIFGMFAIFVPILFVGLWREQARHKNKIQARRDRETKKKKRKKDALKNDIGARVRESARRSESVQREVYAEVLEKATEGLGGELMQRPRGVHLEWRGTVDGVAVRATLKGSSLEVEARLETGPDDVFRIEYDPEVEWSADAPAPWVGSDEVQLFLGKHVFAPTTADFREEVARHLDGLPSELRDHIAKEMPKRRVTSIIVVPESVRLTHSGSFAELPGAHAVVGPWIRLAGRLGRAVDSLEPAAVADVEVHLMACPYCASMFLLTEAAACPNCGAPASQTARDRETGPR